MKIYFLTVCVVFSVLCSACVYAQSQGETYGLAVKAVKAGDNDIAFMHFRTLFNKCSDSRYTERVLFAMAEYYFMQNNFRDAYQLFMRFIEEYPDSKAQLHVFGYLFNIAEALKKDDLLVDVKREMVNRQQQIFLFKRSKVIKYRSPFLRMHKVVYYIDKIEFYVDDTLLTKISF